MDERVVNYRVQQSNRGVASVAITRIGFRVTLTRGKLELQKRADFLLKMCKKKVVLINCYKAWPTINKTVKRKDEKRYVQFLNLKSIEHYLIRKDSKMYDIYVSQIDKKKMPFRILKNYFQKMLP